MVSAADHRALIRAAMRAGCVLLRQKRHLILRTPGGARVVASRSPSDHRATDNLRKTLRQAGVEIE